MDRITKIVNETVDKVINELPISQKKTKCKGCREIISWQFE